MKRILFALLILVIFLCQNASAGDWQIKIMGVTVNDFQDKSVSKILVGVASSIIVHELGHYVYATINGGARYNFKHYRFPYSIGSVEATNYREYSHTKKQMFARVGFLSQILVGGILTIIPNTRHSDFTLGFNSFTTFNAIMYVDYPTWEGSKSNDIKSLDHGDSEGSIYALSTALLTRTNLEGER